MAKNASLSQAYQARFGGLNHTKGATDGEIYDMRNMTSDHYPVLSPREQRRIIATADKIYGIYCYGQRLFVAQEKNNECGLYLNGSKLIDLSPGEKQMAVCAKKLIIYPDKMYYDLNALDHELNDYVGSMGSKVSFSAKFLRYGVYMGTEANNNAIKSMDGTNFSDFFRVGDGVAISGCTEMPQNNKTAIIQEIDGDTLYFYNYAFDLQSSYYEGKSPEDMYQEEYPEEPKYYYFQTNGKWHRFTVADIGDMYEGSIPKGEHLVYAPDFEDMGDIMIWDEGEGSGSYAMPVYSVEAEDVPENAKVIIFSPIYKDTEENSITIEREIPDFDYIISVNNRLWGAKGDTVYGSKLGDPLNWNCFDGVSSDSYSVELGSAGDITGIANYNGYPTFFKEDGIYKLYGAYPSAYQMYATATSGVKKDCGKSITKIGDALYYVSKNGVMVYAGGVPNYIGAELGVRIVNAVGGSDGRKYFLSAENEKGEHLLYVYDTYTGLWHIEDEIHSVAMSYGDALVCGTENGTVLTLGHAESGTLESNIEWWVRFADAVVGSPNKKGVQQAQVRAVCSNGGYCDVYIVIDDKEEKYMGRIEENGKYTSVLPIVLNRGDHFAIILRGHGIVDIYGLSYKYYHGSEM